MNQIYLQNFTKEELIEDMKNVILSEIKNMMGNTSNRPDDTLLTRKEVSEYLRIHISSVGRWVKLDILKPHYIGNRVYFKKSELPTNKKNLI
ncbi:Helix-turn-helix domain-containing protein [Chryseobacterium taichungense]|uniref:Helix-turn-helix domain-containing protein n=1 Tax=Chryseobacterium taichungense TaxID=295069 RepID=A0A1H7WA13_9FLAO|nr:helix-turn-helix domain-containing protein [Chryseobacterium taichungense]SEM18350.1 Helix-turn-helix domain-containing protein [Chryseobacterium taichungense]